MATEPEIPIDKVPKFLVDTASRPGMSGSPVIKHTFGGFGVPGGLAFASGPASKLVGVYSGRIGAEDEMKAQLGVVWHIDLVGEIIRGRSIHSSLGYAPSA